MSENRCIFCGNLAALTREHVWGEWLKEYVELSGTTYGSEPLFAFVIRGRWMHPLSQEGPATL